MADKRRIGLHTHISEPKLAFHPERSEDTAIHPLKGLLDFGPYSQGLGNVLPNPIRVACIAPADNSRELQNLISEFERISPARERKQYLVDFLGFSRIFRTRIVPAGSSSIIELASSFDREMLTAEKPHVLLAENISRAITSLQTHRSDFDVIFIYLPRRWSSGFKFKAQEEDFDLHDYLKAITANRAMPLQIITDNAIEYPCRASVMWRLGIAIYCKSGGVPWKLADVRPESAYIGLSYAMKRVPSGRTRFITCCSQVFDEDGSGLEFLAYETNDFHEDSENPFLSRTEMRRVMARSLSLYQRRHGGRAPKQIVIHKAFPFTNDEVEGCFDAWRSSEGLQLIHVQSDVGWRGIPFEQSNVSGQKSLPSSYPCLRGTCIQLDGRSSLLWTQGNAPQAVGGKNYFKEGKGIPRPLLLRRYAGHGSWDEDARSILALSKMNWNHDGLYDFLPVTIGYAEVLARTVKRIPELQAKPYEFRFFM